MLSLQLKEFLLGGPIGKQFETNDVPSKEGSISSKNEVLNRIEAESKSLVCEWNIFESEERKLVTSLENVLESVENFRSTVDDPELVKKVQLYSLLQSQVQLLSLAKILSELQNFSHVNEIPILIKDLMNILPKNLQNTCKIYKNILLTVTSLQTTILRSFHVNFDSHLETDADSSDAKEMWSAFLGSARDWLLAYALVSILPALISDSRNSIEEKYTLALDEVLTPMWGRFHFHLSSARESKSFEQFVWTFSYAKSFLTLLIDLCTQLTSTGQLEELHQGSKCQSNAKAL